MKKLVWLLIVTLFTSHAFGLSIISDLDDTMKVTNVESLPDAARNAFFSKKSFYQTSEFFSEVKNYTNDLYIVSSSPSLLRKRVNAFLQFNQIAATEVILRNLIFEKDSKKYKLRNIRSILVENPGEEFILIGDDTENDPEVYKLIEKQFPKRIKAIYIRSVKNSKLPDGVQPFITIFDLVMYENQQGRFELTESISIGKSHLLTFNMEKMIPKFAFCPTEKEQFPAFDMSALEFMNRQVRRKIMIYCKTRKRIIMAEQRELRVK